MSYAFWFLPLFIFKKLVIFFIQLRQHYIHEIDKFYMHELWIQFKVIKRTLINKVQNLWEDNEVAYVLILFKKEEQWWFMSCTIVSKQLDWGQETTRQGKVEECQTRIDSWQPSQFQLFDSHPPLADSLTGRLELGLQWEEAS